MTERGKPILFSAPMIRALLDGRKTQTRRVIPEKTQDAYYEYDDWCRNVSAGVPHTRRWAREFFLERSRIQPGDRLWVRESIKPVMESSGYAAQSHAGGLWPYYAADNAPVRAAENPTWRPIRSIPSIHMPRWASRLTLIVTDVRVQQLQEISEEDAIAEGAPIGMIYERESPTHRAGFHDLWNSINGPGSWEANPWVAAYTFNVHRCNIAARANTDPAP